MMIEQVVQLFMNFKWRRATKKIVSFQKDNRVAFYKTLRWLLLVGRFSGFIPIYGLMQQNSQYTGFTFKSPYTLLVISSILLHCSTLLLLYYRFDILNTDIESATQLMYIMINFIAVLLWTSLSRKWKKMITEIESMEETLDPLKKPSQLRRAVRMMLIAVLVAGLTEHGVYFTFVNQLNSDNNNIKETNPGKEETVDEGMSVGIFKYIPYWVLLIRLELCMVQILIAYCLTDVLLLTVSIYLIHRFQDYNELLMRKMLEVRKNISSTITWLELQQRYTTLTQLVQVIDEMVRPYVFLSFTLNLIRIGQQIFFVIRNQFVTTMGMPETAKTELLAVLYLTISLVIVITKTVLVSLVAAHVHTLSRKPLMILHSVPSRAYDYDVQKFMDQVFYSKVCLSGLGFFHITRGMFLTMVATLLTYELMLIQFVVSSST